MTIWLVLIAALALLWFALSPRTARTRSSLRSRIPFLQSNGEARQSFKFALRDALNARGSQTPESARTLQQFSAWLDKLSDKETTALQMQIADTCRRANVDLDWLLTGRAQGETHSTLQDTVLLAALTAWRARALEAFAQLEAYRRNPTARGNRKFGQQLFAKLVETRDIVIPASMMLAPEKERQQYAHQMIEQEAQENQDGVIAAVRAIKGETVPEAPPASELAASPALPAETANATP